MLSLTIRQSKYINIMLYLDVFLYKNMTFLYVYARIEQISKYTMDNDSLVTYSHKKLQIWKGERPGIRVNHISSVL